LIGEEERVGEVGQGEEHGLEGVWQDVENLIFPEVGNS